MVTSIEAVRVFERNALKIYQSGEENKKVNDLLEKNGVDSPYLYLHRGFSIVSSLLHRGFSIVSSLAHP